jgi:SAM-dependent methyltransferase
MEHKKEDRRGEIDPVWEEKYAGEHIQLAPWDTVVSFIFRHAPKDRPRKECRILEVGCGTASNLLFAARQGFAVAGVDAAPSAIEKARRLFAQEKAEGDLRTASFTELPFDDEAFDLAVDRAALTCAAPDQCRRAIGEIGRVLKPGGHFFFNPYSDRNSSAASGTSGGEGRRVGGARADISEGTITGVGRIAFYSLSEVQEMFDPSLWALVQLQHMEYMDMLEPRRAIHAEWRVIARRMPS